MSEYLKISTAFMLGGGAYCIIELLYRQRTHYSMFFCAGIAVMIMYYIYTTNRGISPLLFALAGAIIVSLLELIFGIVFNRFLGEKVWDYSNVPLNFMGQISLPFSLIWYGLSLILYYILKWTKI